MPNIRLRERSILLWAALLLVLAVSAPSAAAPLAQVPPGYELVGDNDQFQLYVDATTLAFKLLDKRSGYLWHSGLDEAADGDRLNNSWRAFARSGLSIEYLDERAINRRVSIANSTTTIETTPLEGGISAQVTFAEYQISVGINVQLEADGVRVEVPAASVHENDANYRLGRVYLYPFLGAGRGSSTPGYMLIPDGTGSLIRFADTTRADSMFYGRYYGNDLGMTGYLPFDFRYNAALDIGFPVFGIAHEDAQSAFLSVVEKGAAYGEAQVHPAGIITNFNFLYHAFVYAETYFQATNRAGAGVTIVQRQPNTFDAVIHYRFLTGDDANYVGMARSYQQYLRDHGMLPSVSDGSPNIGMRLEFLGGDKEKVLLWNRFVPMTTVAQMGDILAALSLPNADVIYYGWQPYGATSMPPAGLALEGGLGSVGELRALADQIAADGGRFSLYLNPQAALWGEAGYTPRTDLAMAITNVEIEGYHRLYANYYFSLAALRWRYEGLVRDLAAQPGIGLALDSIGSVVYSDFRDGSPLSRADAVTAYQTLLGETPLPLGFYRPNDYMLNLTRAYYDMPNGDNGYIYAAQAVPFLPIVLSGHVPYYGSALNFSSNRQDDLLRQIEYGIYPSYYVTHEPTANMLNTPSNWIYTSSYAQWGDEIRETYQWMNALLAPVRGQAIVAHESLAAGVYATTYANGRQIIVNYGDAPFTRGDITVAAQDALLLEDGL